MNPNWFARLMSWATRLTAVDDKGGAGGADDKGAAGSADDKGGAGGADDKGAAGGDAAGAAGGGGADDKGSAAGADDKAGASKDPWHGIREAWAAGDEKKATKLGRYATPTAALDAFISLQDRVRSGELKAQLPKNATDDQVKAWRVENGIPETHDKYDLKLSKDVAIAAEDKPYVDSMLKAIHSHGVNSQIASTVVDLYYDVQRQMTEARMAKDASFAQQSEDALRVDWGNEYRLNINQNQALLAMIPAADRELFVRGRLANGDPIMAHPGIQRWLNALAREINPVAALVPDSGGDIAGGIESEIKKIEGYMEAPAGSADHAKYWKGTEGEATQKRYRELLDGKERATAKK